MNATIASDMSAKTINRPLRLRNPIQHYAWGTRNENAFIPRSIGITPENDLPYAELWIGAHSSAPSAVFMEDGSLVDLNELIKLKPTEMLGDIYTESKQAELPLLLKLLSAGEPLSIQTHPDVEQATSLNANHPEQYPDANAKPEIAVALDHLTALVGFMEAESMLVTFQHHPEIRNLLDPEGLAGDSQTLTQHFEALVKAMMQRHLENPDWATNQLISLSQRLKILGDLMDDRDRLFLDMLAKYGARDIGLIFIFLLNWVELAPGEGMYLDAGIPHAYITGNIVECMGNSDNVIRAGLTPKTIDLENLQLVLKCDLKQPEILPPAEDGNSTVFPTDNPSFRLSHSRYEANQSIHETGNSKPKILLVTAGHLKFHWEHARQKCCMRLRQGQSVLIPACLAEYSIVTVTGSEFFEAFPP